MAEYQLALDLRTVGYAEPSVASGSYPFKPLPFILPAENARANEAMLKTALADHGHCSQ